MEWRCAIIVLTFLASVIQSGNGSRILGICPRASISHQVVFRGLTLALNKRGHELVVVTTDPINDPSLKNYTEIDISHLYKLKMLGVTDMSHWLKSFNKLAVDLNLQTEEILDNPKLKKLYAPHSNEKFDLILVELLYWPAFLFLSQRFNAPVIGLSPMGLPLNVQYALGNPILTSHHSNWELYSSLSGPMNFLQRLDNFISFWSFLYYYKTVFIPNQEAIGKKYLGHNISDLNELEKNVSLVFVNEQTPISFARPNVPKIIQINGLHVAKKVDPLPQGLQKILDEAKEGFVYVSLGSNMKSSMLSNETRTEFIAAFSKLPYRVLWKYENDYLPGKPDNVHIMKWIPQQAVLAHPNIKVFVYQGGLQSTEEAITHGVPLVGLPTWADQRMQVNKLVSLGVGIKLDLQTIKRNVLVEAIHATSFNNSYKENMLNLRKLLIENSHNLLDNAIWWTEHVIRFKGATHLHSTTANDPWYRRQELDLIFFISSVLTIFLMIIVFIIHRLFIKIIKIFVKLSDDKTKKIV